MTNSTATSTSVFRDGLLKARRQLAFTAALVLSTAGIIYLETIDAEDRIRAQVRAEIFSGTSVDVRSSVFQSALSRTIERSVERYTLEPTVANTQASLLVAAALGIAHEIGDPDDHYRRVEEVLARLENEPSSIGDELNIALVWLAGALPKLEARALALAEPS